MADRLIVLLTDFGIQDTYVGVMKGVIAGIAPDCRVIDLTHNIPPGDIRQAAFKLWQAVPYFPQGTVFVIVVDPGVGTSRRPMAVCWPGHTCVAPDNGLLTYLLSNEEPQLAIELANPDYRLEEISTTFHGRDLFSPAAAYLAKGVNPRMLGPAIDHPQRFPLPLLSCDSGPTIRGEVLYIDRFGNAITSLGKFHQARQWVEFQPWLPLCDAARLSKANLRARMPNGLSLELHDTFGQVAVGQALAYIGSEGLLEIGVNQGNAAQQLSLSPGDEILLGNER